MTPDERLDKIEESLRLLAEKYSDERFKRIGDRIDALKMLLEQRADASDIALTVAKTSLNEMRGMAMDQQTAFLTKAEYSSRYEGGIARIDKLEKQFVAMDILFVPRPEYMPKHNFLEQKIAANEKAIIEMSSMAKGANWAIVAIASILSVGISWAVSIYIHASDVARPH